MRDARRLRLVVIRCGYPDRCCLTCRKGHPCGENLAWGTYRGAVEIETEESSGG